MAESTLMYAKLTAPHVDIRFGKLAPGRIVPIDPETFDRWAGAGIIEPSSKKDYEDAREKRAEAAGGGVKGAKLRELAAERSAQWDVATHRDALTAPEANLDKAMREGRPLVNLDRLKDEDGMPLQPDAKLKDIMTARERLQERDPLREHTQSSVSGGGSHYYTPQPLGGADNETLATGRLDHAQEHPSKRGRPRKEESAE